VSRDLAVGVVLSARPWRNELQRYVRDHVVGVALRLVRDPRVGMEEAIDVMVVDDEASFLTPSYVAALRAKGTKLVGVYDPASPDNQGRTHLERLGVDAAVATTAGPEDLVAALRAVVPATGVDERFGALVAGLDLEMAAGPAGQVLAVGGPPGAGATEVAIAVAGVAARTRPVVLVDVDEVNPGVARRLGLGLHPHLLSALDVLHHLGPAPVAAALIEALAQPAMAHAERLRFDVVVGLANREDWNLAAGHDVAVLVDTLRTRWATVVVNLGPQLEDLRRYVDRFGASRAALGAADTVVAVCEASPRGVLRYLDWLSDASALAPRRPIHALVNKAPRSRFRRAELVEQLSVNAGALLASIATAPDDRAVGRAEWDALPVGRGPFTGSIAALADRVLDGPAATRRLQAAAGRP